MPGQVTGGGLERTKVVTVAASAFYTLVVSDKGDVFVWGACYLEDPAPFRVEDQASLSEPERTQWADAARRAAEPRRVSESLLGNVETDRVAAGAEHWVVLARNGQVFTARQAKPSHRHTCARTARAVSVNRPRCTWMRCSRIQPAPHVLFLVMVRKSRLLCDVGSPQACPLLPVCQEALQLRVSLSSSFCLLVFLFRSTGFTAEGVRPPSHTDYTWLGHSKKGDPPHVPQQVKGLLTDPNSVPSAIAAGRRITFATTSNLKLVSWGEADHPALGRSATRMHAHFPAYVGNPEGVSEGPYTDNHLPGHHSIHTRHQDTNDDALSITAPAVAACLAVH